MLGHQFVPSKVMRTCVITCETTLPVSTGSLIQWMAPSICIGKFVRV